MNVVELYNEEPRDLLAAGGTAAQELRAGALVDKEKVPLKISFQAGTVQVLISHHYHITITLPT